MPPGTSLTVRAFFRPQLPSQGVEGAGGERMRPQLTRPAEQAQPESCLWLPNRVEPQTRIDPITLNLVSTFPGEFQVFARP